MANNWNQGGYNQGGGYPNNNSNQYNQQRGPPPNQGFNQMQYGNNNNNMNPNQYGGAPPNNMMMNQGPPPNQYQPYNNNPNMNMNQNQYGGPPPNQQWNNNMNMQQAPNPNMYQNNQPPPQQHQQYQPQPQQQYQPQSQPQPQPQPQTKPLSQSKPAAAARPNPRKGPKAKTREYDHLFKLVLIGDATVGKTSLLLRFADDSFKDNYISTIGVDFRFRTLTIDNDLVKLQIWDTAGQERFRTITSAYYRGSDGVILIYDITNMESFEHVRDWLEDVHKVTGTTIPKLIVGNKSDLQHMRQVNVMQAQQFAMSAGASMIETSAKTADNVDKSFALIAKELVKRGKVTRKSISLHTADEDDDDDDTKKSCCSLV
eukprot:CAMPEP_0197035626 /NCGR_PEP_ID=MMETSP1384-20130603/13373_1 /TAXON_ID=29189 /ORGANISM="Ammonia sp." /LENGTH=371 /DNA_ID=CAMNT_0042465711 /DNA_START=78 /DNA_END=1193 /DNA_ORIENTATION=+